MFDSVMKRKKVLHKLVYFIFFVYICSRKLEKV